MASEGVQRLDACEGRAFFIGTGASERADLSPDFLFAPDGRWCSFFVIEGTATASPELLGRVSAQAPLSEVRSGAVPSLEGASATGPTMAGRPCRSNRMGERESDDSLRTVLLSAEARPRSSRFSKELTAGAEGGTEAGGSAPDRSPSRLPDPSRFLLWTALW